MKETGQEITSLQNPLVKKTVSLHQKKNRQELGLFLIEGYKSITEAQKDRIELKNIFVKKDLKKDISIFDENKIIYCDEKVLKKVSTTDSAVEIIAIAKQFRHEFKDLFKKKNPLIIALENIKDPGNLGTIIRTANAFNASGIVLLDDTTDIYNPKVVRSSCSNLWRIPVISIKDKQTLKEKFRKYNDFQFIATIVKAGKENILCNEIDYKKPTVIMLGSESHGISKELATQADLYSIIPMNKDVESLNLSTSTAIFLYEAMTQNRS